MTDLSIIILNYNTKEMALASIASIEKNYTEEVKKGTYEVIIIDNYSQDNSAAAFEAYKKTTIIKHFHVIANPENMGFAAGNNKGIPYANGRYILFLNPDTVVYHDTLRELTTFMDHHKDAGAATCKVEIPNGGIDEASHRGFPTPWNAFCHFSKLEKVFPKNKFFAGYIQGWKDLSVIHEVDAVVGAFLFVRREVGDKIGWWDEDYQFYGEDLQFCYNIRHLGYKIYYVPTVGILHYGGVSSGIKKQSQNITTASRDQRKKVQGWRFEAMRIFFKKNYQDKYPKPVNWLVHQGINLLHKKNSS